jgi:hypothetical protein
METVSSFRTKAVFIWLAALVFMLPQASMANVAPVANDQDFYMRAAELLALPITLAATDADCDALTYYIVSGPSNGTLIGTGPRLEYLPYRLVICTCAVASRYGGYIRQSTHRYPDRRYAPRVGVK